MGNLISIVIPVYNAEKYVERCLQSVVNQTYKNIEIIIVYLNSSDQTLEKINTFKDKRIIRLEQIEQTGPGGARNLGIKVAQGKYIGFVEADDFIDLDYYEKLYINIESNNSDIAIAEVAHIRNNKLKYPPRKNSLILTSFYDKYKMITNGGTFDKLYKAEFIKEQQIEFPENVRFEDNPWILQAIYYSKKMSFAVGTYYNYCPGPWSAEYRDKLKKDVLPIARLMVDFAKTKNFTRKEFHLVQKKIIDSFAITFLIEDNVYTVLADITGCSFYMKSQWVWRKYKFYKKKYLLKIKNFIIGLSASKK